MENVRIIDLKVDNIVQFQAPFKGITAMQTAIVNRVYAKEKSLKTVWYAEVENAGGYKFTLTDNDDFVRVDEPFTRKVDMVHQPSHYHSENGIDLIEFCRQQFTDEEFRGAMKFTQMRYSLRTGRKENDLQDQSKLKEYADRFMEVLNNATR